MLNITIKHSQTETSLVFHCQLWVLPFLLVATFFIITIPIFSAYLHKHMWTRYISQFCYLSINLR